MLNKKIAVSIFALMIFPLLTSTAESSESDIEKTAIVADKAVFRVICQETNLQGTGFLIQSGYVLTAAHVVQNCRTPIVLVPGQGNISTSVQADDAGPDLAALKPSIPIKARGLSLGFSEHFRLGEQVATFGFPGGYNGGIPLLSVGYFGGVEQVKDNEGRPVWREIINAPFNHGNSGGPLFSMESGDVIGVVSDKLVPLSPFTSDAIMALAKTRAGAVFTVTDGNGERHEVLEGQLVAQALNDLMNNAQIVIGHTTMISDVHDFIEKNHLNK